VVDSVKRYVAESDCTPSAIAQSIFSPERCGTIGESEIQLIDRRIAMRSLHNLA